MLFTETVTMSKGEIKCLIAHASRDSHHPNMCAVTLDAAGRRAFATDGLRLVVACGPGAAPTDEHSRPFLVPIPAAEQAAKFTACRFFYQSTGRRSKPASRQTSRSGSERLLKTWRLSPASEIVSTVTGVGDSVDWLVVMMPVRL